MKEYIFSCSENLLYLLVYRELICLTQEINSCPFCGSYNVFKNKCQDCERDIREQKFSNTLIHGSYAQNQPATIPIIGLGSNYYELRKGNVYDSAGNKVCSKKFVFLHIVGGNIKLKTDLGYLQLQKIQPDRIELFDINDSKLGQLVVKDKDLFVLETLNDAYDLTPLGKVPIRITDKTGNVVLTIEENPSGETKRLGIRIPSYKFLTTEKLKLETAILVTMFVANYYSFMFGIKPASKYSFTVKGRTGLKFYDSQGNLYARTTGVNKIWWIIGFLTAVFIIGFFIIIYLSLKFQSQDSIILERTGEKIGTYKGNFNLTKANFTVPSHNWNGSISFKSLYFMRNLSASNDTIETTDGNYNLKLLTIVENENKNRMMTVYGWVNDFVIVKNDQFDDYKSLVLATLIIRRYLVPRKN